MKSSPIRYRVYNLHTNGVLHNYADEKRFHHSTSCYSRGYSLRTFKSHEYSCGFPSATNIKHKYKTVIVVRAFFIALVIILENLL